MNVQTGVCHKVFSSQKMSPNDMLSIYTNPIIFTLLQAAKNTINEFKNIYLLLINFIKIIPEFGLKLH